MLIVADATNFISIQGYTKQKKMEPTAESTPRGVKGRNEGCPNAQDCRALTLRHVDA